MCFDSKSAAYSLSLLVMGTLVLQSCKVPVRVETGSMSGADVLLDEGSSSSFLECCRMLERSGEFRQNIWLSARGNAWAGICMDRQKRLYLVIPTVNRKHLSSESSGPFQHLRVDAGELRRRLDPEAFILGSSGAETKSALVYQIPTGAGESFGEDVLNHHFCLKLKPEELRFQWD